MCFLADPLQGGRVAFVQFPQRFDGVDRNDRYANHNTIFYDVRTRAACHDERNVFLSFFIWWRAVQHEGSRRAAGPHVRRHRLHVPKTGENGNEERMT